jgi:hypothetical protein
MSGATPPLPLYAFMTFEETAHLLTFFNQWLNLCILNDLCNVYLQNWAEMQFAVFNLLIFFILAVVDVGSAVYTRYVLNEDNKVMYKLELDLVNHSIVVLRLTRNCIFMIVSLMYAVMAGNSSGNCKFLLLYF